MKGKAPTDALTRVAQARAAADRSLAAWHRQGAAWRATLQRIPPWAVVLAGVLGGAVAGRVLGRVRPRREAVRWFALLAPWARLALEALVPPPSTPAAPATAESATPARPAAASASGD